MLDSKKVLITGASGLVGSRLTELLTLRGYEVFHLSRSKRENDQRTFVWNVYKNFIDKDAFTGIDTIIHLAGAGVAEKRWTKERKKEILESRTRSTALLFQELNTRKHNISTFISASAIGFYGFENENHVFTEQDVAGKDFLADVTQQWEKEVDRIGVLNIRVVKARIGIVLSKKGGALEPIVKTVGNLVGAPLGSGKQYLSWIHLDDLCGMLMFMIENQSMHGAYNVVAPEPVTNKKFTEVVAGILHKPLLLPNVPAFTLKLWFGEMADIVLKGSKVSCKKMMDAGYQFLFPDLSEAIKDLTDQ